MVHRGRWLNWMLAAVGMVGVCYTLNIAHTIRDFTAVQITSVAVVPQAILELRAPPLQHHSMQSTVVGETGKDVVYDGFNSCALTPRGAQYPQWEFRVNNVTGLKSCTITVTPYVAPGVAWGPITSYNWNGDFGYWYDAPGVRDRAWWGLGGGHWLIECT